MNKIASSPGTSIIKIISKGVIAVFCVPLLSVWTIGSVVCAVIAPVGGLLGVFGIKGIGINIASDYNVPNILSLPFGLLLSLLLFLSFYYTRRLLRICLNFIKNNKL